MTRLLAKLPYCKSVFFFLVLCSSTCISSAQPSEYLDKINSTPDLTQTDQRGQFAENGTNYCAPVAVSNSFVWLANHGYSKLMETPEACGRQEKTNAFNQQIAIAKILSSPEYMNTKANEGTYVDNVLLGIKNYVLKRGYSIKQLSYQGFRSHLQEFDIGVRNPRLPLLKEGIIGKSGVWLNIGWYQHKVESSTYVRVGGHWVSLVGYEPCKDSQRSALIIHNPSPRAGSNFHNDVIYLEPIQGVLVSRRGLLGFPRPAWGFFKILGDLTPIPGSDTAILESAVILELY